MFEIYIIALISMGLIILYVLLADKNNEDDYNLMEDVPTISVNREELEKHSMQISQYYSSVTRRSNCRRKLIKSLDKSYEEILKAYEYIDREIKLKREVVPAAEWMLDNLYLIEKEYKDIKYNMPTAYYKGLPVISKGMLKGYPRAYHLAVELVSHTDGRIDEELIETFINAYQKNTVLNIGELWALPIMIKIALIQNISKIAERLSFSIKEKQKGTLLGEKLIDAYNDKTLDIELEKLKNEDICFNSHFIERLIKLLRDNGVDNEQVYKWIDDKLDLSETTADKMITLEHQKQAGFQVSIGNSIMSIREVSTINWKESFRKLSFVEKLLKGDPSKTYVAMDFESRDYYRHKIEKIAKDRNLPENVVAKKAVDCAQASQGEVYERHVGYYLIDEGIHKLNKVLGIHNNLKSGLKKIAEKNKVYFYLGVIITGTLLISLSVLGVAAIENKNADIFLWKYFAAITALIIPCSEIVISIFNWSINRLREPRFIPKLELSEGIPDDSGTVVVIPTLLNNVKRVHELISNMEVYYLANKEKNLYFALLGDFKDSTTEQEDTDKDIVREALLHIKTLNEKYANGKEDIFYFFNRYRQYNEKEGLWLGWERKRGKLMEFNALLRGSENTSYDVISGDISMLKKVKYVITLDGDTELPMGAARKLIGAMSHVLNKPYIDKKRKKVIRGYGIMQPRVSVGIIAANKTMFSRIFSGEAGIDMYTTAVSDVYQDVFGEGIFTGKGIYDVDTFSYMLEDEILENKVLSHDLLEGSFARTALLTDVELIDGYPAYYNSSSMRLHRWIRGDWQLIGWITKSSSLNLLSRWKIIDNLRRSLLAPSIIILALLSFTLLPYSEQYLITAVLAVLCPILFDMSESVVEPVKGISLSGRVNSGKLIIEQIFLIFCFLPYMAYLMLDAIIRTLYRLFISKKKLLEWQTAADVELKLKRDTISFIRAMFPGSLISLVIAVLAFNKSYNIGLLMLPSCLFWFISPILAYFVSKENRASELELSQEDIKLLRRISRKTWAYFEDFVNVENNFLAPDNYQENPPNGVAHRTSPTNMGMGLASNFTAYDLGYIGLLELVERCDKILASMEGLTRYKGHFYNWYDTITKEPLYPRYISTVDSGNLAGYLWLCSEGLEEYVNNAIIDQKKLQGLCDILELCSEELQNKAHINDFYSIIIRDIKSIKLDIVTWKKFLMNIWSKEIEIQKIEGCEGLYWNTKCKHFISKNLGELQKLFPWVDLITNSEDNVKDLGEKLRELPSKLSFMELYSELASFMAELEKEYIVSLNEISDEDSMHQLYVLLNNSLEEIKVLYDRINDLKKRFNDIVEKTDFSILYDKKMGLFSIGYDLENDTLGNSHYDLLASESRQASFVAIAKGDVDSRHWFKLGRAMAFMGKSKGLVSWSGTMFEYFMPLLIMKNYPNTLLNETYSSVIDGQKRYCKKRGVPWGISESAYYTFDSALNYQYKAFGIPGIGLKRGLANELVISPYSTVMALQIDAAGAVSNMKQLIAEGLEGVYGFYEAVDYTKDRTAKERNKEIVKCFMVHHEGMSLMSLNNVLNNNILQERFHRIPMVKAAELLLQERVSKKVVYDREQKFELVDFLAEKQNIIARSFNSAKTTYPETHLLSNGSYTLMLTNSGSGYSKLNDMTVYRWREDLTLHNTGMFFYIKNLNSNEYWSAAYEPCKVEGENYKALFSLDKVEYKRRDGNLDTHTEITLSQEDNAEVRKISVTNHSGHSRTVEITSYCEVTLAPYNADLVHPAFSNLFIKTEYVENPSCIIGSRRPRAKGQKKPHVVQTIAVYGETIGTVQYETSRANFIGRGRDVSNPLAMENDAHLKNGIGAVLDPIISIRRRLKIEPGKTAVIAYTTAVADTREEAVELAKKYSEMQNVNRAFEISWSQMQVELKYLGLKSTQANLYQKLASKILFINPSLGERGSYIRSIKKCQSALWTYGISGDLPILLVILRSENSIDIVRQCLKAHEYLSLKGLKLDLVIISLQNTIYTQPILVAVRDLVSSSHARDKQNKPGGVYIHSKSTMAEEDIDLLMAIARLVVDGEKEGLFQQVKFEEESRGYGGLLEIKDNNFNEVSCKLEEPELEFFNGFGGFDIPNEEYVIILKNHRNCPAPWINVISNGEFGFQVSESGSSYTWYKNSRENKLTDWSNDPISDPLTEALYIRDEITGRIWGITGKPERDEGEYIIRHGFGYSSFKHAAQGIVGEMTMFVPMDESVKLILVKLKNNSPEKRSLSLTYYAHMVLGVVPQMTAQYISTYLNEDGEFIYAQNPYSEHFGKGYAYLAVKGGEFTSFTGNRTEFLGTCGSAEKPEALHYKSLSNTTGSGYDPCLCCNAKVSIEPGEVTSLVIMLGQNTDINRIKTIINQYENIKAVEQKLIETKKYWKELLHKIQVKTPDKTMDIMLNGWLMYQTISCRYWSRTAFYQSGGAIGFRDQLQDVMSIGFLNSSFTRQQILHSASRQFLEGDVQHWWHPVVNSGIRTRFSDDLLWLPYVTYDYIRSTGDYTILEEEVTYLEEEPLKEGEDERYKVTLSSDKKGSIYEHCVRAIEKALKFGQHNIPLMGSGDWNDGMSTVGNEGKGESVWLGWFLYSILDNFIELCKHKNEEERALKYEEIREFIRENLERNAWDGGWYRRAYFDDGTPLGSAHNDECQIDSLSQSWAVISGAGRPSRTKEAMEAVERNLIKEDKGMVLLLTPPFNNSKLEPGYIKGYVPGVRENGGQYTHASIWVIWAMAKLGYGNKAWRTYHMINPINHTKSYLDAERYKVEPYVIAADVYAAEGQVGRGGWSWYTGSASWMYRVGIEALLGLKLKGKKGFSMEPCIPDEWSGFEMKYTNGKCSYNIKVRKGENKMVVFDGKVIADGIVPYLEGMEHEVEVILN